MAEVVLDGVSKVYAGGVKAVDGVSLRIEDREFVVLVGPSGCGKSTTLRMVAGLEDITSGVIRIGPRVVNDVAPKDRDIAMVFQNYALYPHMTVYRNMAFGLMLRRRHALWDNPLAAVVARRRWRAAREERSDIDRRVRDAAEMLGITDLLKRRPKALSGGQRQRVAVGRAIVREPAAYLFDEPLSNLDAKLRVEMRAEIKKLHRRVQTTTIYVTHDQEEAMTLGDRVVVMKNGIVQQHDTPFAVYERPANRFVAGFVGTPPMNFLDGRLVRSKEQIEFEEGSNRFVLDPACAQRMAQHVGQPVTIGIRPEHLRPARTPDGGARLRVNVSVVEPLGDRMDVRAATLHGEPVTCRIDARERVAEGSTIDMDVDMSRVHFFEQGGRQRTLSLPAPA